MSFRKPFIEGLYFGQRHPEFNYNDYEFCRRIKRLEKKYYRLCVAQANGEISPDLYRQEDSKLTKKVETLIRERNAELNKLGIFEKPSKAGRYKITYCDLTFTLSYNDDFIPLDLI